MAPILQIEGLTRRFGGVTAVNALSLASTKASWSASSGRTAPARPPSFNLVTGLDSPDAGT
jgi:branched-chain amino acid transport system ATP-binding protein